jgi:hypothetical protein
VAPTRRVTIALSEQMPAALPPQCSMTVTRRTPRQTQAVRLL